MAQGIIFLYFFFMVSTKLTPDIGCVVLALIGAACLLRRGAREKFLRDIGGWTRQDTYLACAIASVFVFKMLSMLWAKNPELAMKNALWHAYFIAWPLVFVAFCSIKLRLSSVLEAMAAGMIVIAVWDVASIVFNGTLYHQYPVSYINAGILAQMLLVMGSWLFVAATDKSAALPKAKKLVFAIGALSAWFILYTTERRTEWIGFFIILLLVGFWRIRHWLTPARSLVLFVTIVGACAAFFYMRQERFLLAFNEAFEYWQHAKTGADAHVLDTSVGARLEMYRLGLAAFKDHILFGNSADIRPNMLPQYGGLTKEEFPHRHFHSEYLQALVEGGLVWASVFLTAIVYLVRTLIVKPFASSNLTAMLAFALVASFMLAGTVSVSLVYTQSVAMFTVFSALLWANLRLKSRDH